MKLCIIYNFAAHYRQGIFKVERNYESYNKVLEFVGKQIIIIHNK